MILCDFPPLGDQSSERLFAHEAVTVRDSLR